MASLENAASRQSCCGYTSTKHHDYHMPREQGCGAVESRAWAVLMTSRLQSPSTPARRMPVTLLRTLKMTVSTAVLVTVVWSETAVPASLNRYSCTHQQLCQLQLLTIVKACCMRMYI